MEIPCVYYLYLHSKIFEKFKIAVSYKDIKKFLFEWRIPQKLRPLIIKELEILKLIKKKKNTYELKKPQIYEENVNKYYEMLGMFDNGR